MEEINISSALRATRTAVALFFMINGLYPGGSIEINDAQGRRLAIVELQDEEHRH